MDKIYTTRKTKELHKELEMVQARINLLGVIMLSGEKGKLLCQRRDELKGIFCESYDNDIEAQNGN